MSVEAGNRAPPRISSGRPQHCERSIVDEQKILKDNAQALAKVGRRMAAAFRALESNLSL
jgi:hypothetical protein